MSTENATDSSPNTILHFINSNNSDSSSNHNDENEIASNHNTEIEQSKENGVDEKPIKTASHSRRVHFPIDDTQLCLISYPPAPLSNQPLLSLTVILQRYRAVCHRLQLRPFNCLVEQLSTMDDGRNSYYDRLDCLKIVNEKIDIKHVDAIEEILSHCRFHTLDFDSTTMDDAALGQLFEVIEYYESCTHINLSHNRSIGYLGYQALTKYLRKTNSLERLDMNAIRFDDNSISSFTRSLRLSSTLYELHVESCQLTGRLLQKFIYDLRLCTSLRELYLCDNRLQPQDSLLINDLIRTCGRFLFLLDLRMNALQDTGMSHLASQFSQYDENHTNASVLHKISVQGNQITQQGVVFLAKSLLHNRTLRSLNLSDNNITNEGLVALRDALLTNRTINELILRNCHLTDQAAIALAEFIAESTTIQYIDIRENNIQASGICGLSIAMKNNRSLFKLEFDPIVSTPTNLGVLSNNINRATNSTSVLSLANFRRMTTGFGSFTSSTPSNSNRGGGGGGGGGGTKELLEQKRRWMDDIAAVCQRNVLIYEENLRLAEEESVMNKRKISKIDENHQKDSTTVQLEDVELKDEEVSDRCESKENTPPENLTSINSNNHEDINQSMDMNTIEQVNNISSIENTELEDSLDIPIDEKSSSANKNTNSEHLATIPIEDHDDINVEQTITTSASDNHEIEQLATDLVESIVNDENQEQSESNIINENSMSDLIDDISNDDKRKLHHSDSLRLTRKKSQK